MSMRCNDAAGLLLNAVPSDVQPQQNVGLFPSESIKPSYGYSGG